MSETEESGPNGQEAVWRALCNVDCAGIAEIDAKNRLLRTDKRFLGVFSSAIGGVASSRLSVADLLIRGVAAGDIQIDRPRTEWLRHATMTWTRYRRGVDITDRIGRKLLFNRIAGLDNGHVIAMLVDISDSLARETRLTDTQETALARLHEAMNALPIGTALFDPENRLVAVNQRYRELFDLPEALGEAGQTQFALLDYQLDLGRFVTDTEAGAPVTQMDIVQRLLALSPGMGETDTYHHNSGRRIEIRRHCLSDGSLLEASAEIPGPGAGAETWFQELARYDAVTGLVNRGYFRGLVPEMAARLGKEGRQGFLAVLRLENMAEIYEFLGHGQADRVLQALARRLRGQLGLAEEGEFPEGGPLVARLGDVVFGLLLPDMDSPDAAAAFAERLLGDLQTNPIRLDSFEVDTSLALGFCSLSLAEGDPADLLHQAELAMAQAREQAHPRYCFYQATLSQRAAHQGSLQQDLQHAVDRGELRAFYQPKVDLRSGWVEGVEALMRWQHRERGLISPAEFIPVAEHTGLIAPITDWMLREACAQAKAWRDSEIADLRVAVNLSQVQFRRRSVITSIENALAETGLPPEQLEIEITESVLLQEDEGVAETFRWLKEQGIPIAIDDFGTGYSSLSYLKRYPVDKLKVDASFVRALHQEHEDAAIIRAVISLAHSLGIKVIAEGIEEESHVMFLADEGCDEGQGYYFGRPLPAAELQDFLLSPGRRFTVKPVRR